MEAASDGHNPGQVSAQTGDAESIDLDSRQTRTGHERLQASGSARRIAELQRADVEVSASIDPLVADQALTAAEQQRDSSVKIQNEFRQSPEAALADVHRLQGIDRRHAELQAIPAGDLGAVAAREAVTSDVDVMNRFVDKVLQGQAASVLGITAHQHPAYKAALGEVSPPYAALAERSAAGDPQRLLEGEGRQASEGASRRDNAGWTAPGASAQPGLARDTTATESPDRAPPTRPTGLTPGVKTPERPESAEADLNSVRSQADTTGKRRAIEPLEDRFNVLRTGPVEKEYHFRDQAGKVAFTDRLFSISTTSESPAAIKGMVERAAERGWQTVSLKGSAEFVRQGWIAANAQGLNAVGHTPTASDRDAVIKERARLEMGPDIDGVKHKVQAIGQAPSAQVERVSSGSRDTQGHGESRHLATAIEKALVDGKVSPEIRGQVRAMMAAEGARRAAGGERVKVPVYDARAPRARAKTIQAGPQQLRDRERSR